MIIVSIVLILLALLGAPLFAVIGAGALWGFFQSDVDLSVVAIEMYRLVDMPTLIAIPLFTFAGYILSESRASERLVRVTDALLGWMPGGHAIVAITVSAFFTALTGASGVTIVALGGLLYSALRQAGYSEKFSLGLITSSGSLGMLFPPSLALILYGVIAQQVSVGRPVAIDDLFIAGLLPGLLILAMLFAWSIWASPRHTQSKKPFSLKEARAAVREAIWELPLPFIVLAGIYSGHFAISEAAAVSVLYVLIAEVLIHREIRYRDISKIMRDSMVLVGGVLIVLSVSLASTNYLIDADVPNKIFALVKTHIDSKFTFLILLNIFLLVFGMMLEILALVIMVPLLLPIAIGYDIDPIHFGIIFIANLQIGYFIPPAGMSLFIASYRFKKSILELYRASIPFMIILIIAVLIITYFPSLSLVLLKHP